MKLMMRLESLLLLIFGYLFTQFRYQATTFPATWHAFLLSLILFHALVEPAAKAWPFFSHWQVKLKWAIVLLVIAMTLGWSSLMAIKMRYLVGETYPVHDNPIQLEEAAKFLVQGKNPYAESFADTPLDRWLNWKDNPSVNHVVTLPFYVVSTAVASLIFERLTGVMDGRIIHFIVLLAIGLIFFKARIDTDKKRFLTILFFLNPLWVHFFIDGRNDAMVFSLVLLSLWFLGQKRWYWSAVFLGLAGATKQHAWLLFPLYLAYVYALQRGENCLNRLKSAVKKMMPALVVMAVWVLPFLIWDARAFFEDVISYPAGNVAMNYPIKGDGFSVNLVNLGVIKSANDNFPFWIFQTIVCLPLLIFLIKYLLIKPSIKRLIQVYAWLMLAFWLWSRFFLENYVGYLSMLLIVAELFEEKK